ncbi:MAG TPA: serine/threonine-protein kinase [Candidatus Binatus sp.]|nr:serine/threonine-protein kinase [Candidatus Binatus sp.]
MNKAPADKFIEAVTPLLHLWQAVRVSGMALYSNGQWFNLGIRVQLLESPPSSTDIQSPDQRLLYYVIDYPLGFFSDVVRQLTTAGAFTVEEVHGAGGTFAEVSLRPPRPETGLGINWYPPNKREPTPEQRKEGIRRSFISLVSSGQSLNEILDYDLRSRLDSKLRFVEPPHDGFAGLAKHLFPGVGFENWQQTLVEIVAELPFEIESKGDMKVTIRASPRASDPLTTVCFYEPRGGIKPVRTILRRDETDRLDTAQLKWDRILDWPEGTERAKVTLFYKEEEIQSVQLARTAQPTAGRTKSGQAPKDPPKPNAKPLPPSPRGSSLKGMPIFKTALEVYLPLEIVGTGGAGVVYKVEAEDHQIFAVKCLDPRRVTTAKRKRFKTELHFCSKNEHRNIITVLDQGVVLIDGEDAAFYVMPYYAATLRELMKAGISSEKILPIFSQILDGVEAAHLKNVWHRDLKPENVLYDTSSQTVLVADFGIAHFGEEELYTLVETKVHERLANFQYAAPEQRARGKTVDHRADIFAAGLILNEMFTGHIIQGEGYARVGKVAPEFSYLDEIIAKMVQQSAEDRPNSIAEIKQVLIARGNEFVSLQKLSALRQTVVPAAAVTHPFLNNPLKRVSVDIRGNSIVALLNDEPMADWLRIFVRQRVGSFVTGCEPANWRFNKNEAAVALRPERLEAEARSVVRHFDSYVEHANSLFREHLEVTARQREENEKRELQKRIEEEQRRLRILGSL